MKKSIFVLAAASFALFASCGSTSSASSGGEAKAKPAAPSEEAWVQPEDVITGAAGFDEEEAKTPYNMADGVVEAWSLDGGKAYLHTGDLWAKFQYEDSSDWAADIISGNTEFIDVGEGDKIVSFNLKMNKHYGLIQNFTEQGKNPKSVKNVVWKQKVYIPEQYCDPNIDESNVPVLRFQIRDQNWGIIYLSGDIDKIPVRELGAGWHVLTIDFANSTFDFGTKTGTFRVNQPRKANALEIQFDGKGFKTAYPIMFDWISIEGLE